MIDLSTDQIVFWGVVAARILIPLAVFQFPLPAMLAALVLDGLTRRSSRRSPACLRDYQSYDKALDVYYLAIAYISMMRNWVSRTPSMSAVPVLLPARRRRPLRTDPDPGAAARLPEHVRVLLRPYEAVRTRWDPRRLGPACSDRDRGVHLDRHQAPPGVVDPRRPARRDGPDQDHDLRRSTGRASWTDAIAARPWVLVVVVARSSAVVAARWLILHRLPPADHPFTLDADSHQPMVDGDAIDRERRTSRTRRRPRAAREGRADRPGQHHLQPDAAGRRPGRHRHPVGVGARSRLNTVISSLLVRRGDRPHGAVLQFVVMVALNVAIVRSAFVSWDPARRPAPARARVRAAAVGDRDRVRPLPAAVQGTVRERSAAGAGPRRPAGVRRRAWPAPGSAARRSPRGCR